MVSHTHNTVYVSDAPVIYPWPPFMTGYHFCWDYIGWGPHALRWEVCHSIVQELGTELLHSRLLLANPSMPVVVVLVGQYRYYHFIILYDAADFSDIFTRNLLLDGTLISLWPYSKACSLITMSSRPDPDTNPISVHLMPLLFHMRKNWLWLLKHGMGMLT